MYTNLVYNIFGKKKYPPLKGIYIFMNRFVYADNAATTSVSPEVLESMMPYLTGEYGNPSSLYTLGRRSSDAITQARNKIASLLGAKPNEIFFTSCGSEADNWAIKGAARANASKGKHIISTVFEHHAVCTGGKLHLRKARQSELEIRRQFKRCGDQVAFFRCRKNYLANAAVDALLNRPCIVVDTVAV